MSSTNPLLRLITCGSVDDGKSTLIGRLLFDTKTILSDTLQQLSKTSQKRGLDTVDLSLLTDGLQAEREQGITIDVAYRYFSTGTRKYIIADSPGHEQYTRNMVTAASTAELAIILIDARKGLITQTRRHSYLLHLLDVPYWIVAVNKMDLVDYNEKVFNAICKDYREFAEQFQSQNKRSIEFIPLSALNGDMVVDRGNNMPWYEGEPLLDLLENVQTEKHSIEDENFCFPVQYVCRPQASQDKTLHDFRGFMGRVESGEITVGDTVTILPNGEQTTIKKILLQTDSLDKASAGQSVTLLLNDEIDISRGDMITTGQLIPIKEITAYVCWFLETPLALSRTYILRHTTREAKAKVTDIAFKIDMNTLAELPTDTLKMNDIAKVTLKLAHPIMAESYTKNHVMGSFILIDETSFFTVAAGMII